MLIRLHRPVAAPGIQLANDRPSIETDNVGRLIDGEPELFSHPCSFDHADTTQAGVSRGVQNADESLIVP